MWVVGRVLREEAGVAEPDAVGREGDGRYLKRKIPAEIIAGPAL